MSGWTDGREVLFPRKMHVYMNALIRMCYYFYSNNLNMGLHGKWFTLPSLKIVLLLIWFTLV